MKKLNLKKILIMILVMMLLSSRLSIFTPADDSKQSLEQYLEELKVQLKETNDNIDSLYVQIRDVNQQIAANQELLENQQASLAEQKASMVLRIKYMYERGSALDIITSILSSDTFAEAINKASYILEIVSYDRRLFDEYAATVSSIKNTQGQLESEKEALVTAIADFEESKYRASEEMAAVNDRLVEYELEEARAQEILEQMMREIAQEQAEAAAAAAAEEENNNSGNDTYVNDDPVQDDRTDSSDDGTTSQSGNDGVDTTPSTGSDTAGSGSDGPTYDEPKNPGDTGNQGGTGTGNPYNFTDDEIYTIARISYLEDGCVYPGGTYRSIYLCACVIINRALNWYGGSVDAAIYAPGQYATAYKYTDWGGGSLNINDITWTAVYDALNNLDTNPYYQCNGNHLESMGLVEYYRDEISNEVFYLPR